MRTEHYGQWVRRSSVQSNSCWLACGVVDRRQSGSTNSHRWVSVTVSKNTYPARAARKSTQVIWQGQALKCDSTYWARWKCLWRKMRLHNSCLVFTSTLAKSAWNNCWTQCCVASAAAIALPPKSLCFACSTLPGKEQQLPSPSQDPWRDGSVGHCPGGPLRACSLAQCCLSGPNVAKHPLPHLTFASPCPFWLAGVNTQG